jgi:hypothetical protein
VFLPNESYSWSYSWLDVKYPKCIPASRTGFGKEWQVPLCRPLDGRVRALNVWSCILTRNSSVEWHFANFRAGSNVADLAWWRKICFDPFGTDWSDIFNDCSVHRRIGGASFTLDKWPNLSLLPLYCDKFVAHVSPDEDRTKKRHMNEFQCDHLQSVCYRIHTISIVFIIISLSVFSAYPLKEEYRHMMLYHIPISIKLFIA